MRNMYWTFGVLACAISAHVEAAPTTIVNERFDLPTVSPKWQIGAQQGGSVSISRDTAKNYSSSKGSLRGTYPISGSGEVYAWAAYDLSALRTDDIYIEFDAKMPNAKQGLKFVKIFGGQTSGPTPNFANTSFFLDNTGSMVYVAFGDGSATANDTANGVWLAGLNDTEQAYHGIGRSQGIANVLTPQNSIWSGSNWGTGWHHFKLHVKFNSGTTAQNEVANGELYVEIDGVVYVKATGLFNRHYTNAPIDSVQFLGWAQAGTSPFEVWYDNIRITTGGFYSTPCEPAQPN